MKSANARSGEMLVKWILFCGLLWIRRHTVGVCMCVCVHAYQDRGCIIFMSLSLFDPMTTSNQ